MTEHLLGKEITIGVTDLVSFNDGGWEHMGNFLKKYCLEIVISILGIALALISFKLNQSNGEDYSVELIIVTVTVLSDCLSLSIKSAEKAIAEHVEKQIKKLSLFDKLFKDFHNIRDPWKADAERELMALTMKISDMCSGHRTLTKQNLITYQADLMKSSRKRVYAIHRALDLKSLNRWDENNTTKDFTEVLISANHRIKPSVDKRRIFLINPEDLEDEAFKAPLKKILKKQRVLLGFKVRVLLKNSSENENENIDPPDMLICDDEVVVVHFVDSIAKGEIETSEAEVSSTLNKFNEYWQIARPVRKILK